MYIDCKIILFALFFSSVIFNGGFGQTLVNRPSVTLRPQRFDYKAYLRQSLRKNTPIFVDSAKYTRSKSDFSANKTSSVSISTLGTSSDAFTIINNRARQVWVDNASQTMGWIHRQDINIFGAGGSSEAVASGVHRFDYSIDGGKTFPDVGQNTGLGGTNFGPLNPLPFSAQTRPRFPQGLVYTPAGQTGRENLRLVWLSPCTNGSAWGNYASGVAKSLTTIEAGLTKPQVPNPNIKYSFQSAQNDLQTYIPGGLSKGRDGEFFAIDNFAFYDKFLPALQLWKGVADETHSEASWQKFKTFEIPTLLADELGSYRIERPNMAFSPDGKHGWICATANVNLPQRPGQCETALLLYRSRDYGDSWQGPFYCFGRDYSAITDSIAYYSVENNDTIYSSKIPSVLSFDITVDANGNPHVFTSFANAANPTCAPDSLGYFQTGRFALFDMTTHDGGETFYPQWIARQYAYKDKVYGMNLTFDNYLQIARSEDGTRLFYSWLDDPQSPKPDSMRADVWDRAMRLSDGALTPLRSVSKGDAVFGEAIFFPAIAPVAYQLGEGKYRIPTIFLKILENEYYPCEFYMINDRDFTEEDFALPQNEVSVSLNDTLSELCYAVSTPVSGKIKNRGTLPIGPQGVKVSYQINGAAPVFMNVPQATGLAAGGEVDFTFSTPAVLESGTNFISVLVEYAPDEFLFNNLAQKTITNFGGASAPIFTENTTTVCGESLTLNTGWPGLPTKWYVNGGPPIDELQNQSTVTFDKILLGGTAGTVIVAVTNPNCNDETLTDAITVTLVAPPPVNIFPADTGICKSNAPLVLKASPNENYQFAWYKRAADGTYPAQPFAMTNKILINATDYYKITVKDPNYACETTQETRAILWDMRVNERLGLTDTFICGQATLSAAHEGVPQNARARYDWYLTGEVFDRATGEGYTYDHTLVQSGPNPYFITPQDTFPRPMRYRVVAQDPLGCKTVEESLTVTVFDSIKTAKWKIGFSDNFDGFYEDITDSNFVKFFCGYLTAPSLKFEKQSIAGATPITGVQWELPSVGFDIPDELQLGTPLDTTQTPNIGTQITRGIDTFKVRILCMNQGEKIFKLTLRSGACEQSFTKKLYLDASISRDSLMGALSSVRIYPNPASGVFNVQIQARQAGPLTTAVFDATGKSLLHEYHGWVHADTDFQTAVDLRERPAGIYLLKIETARGFQTVRLVKE